MDKLRQALIEKYYEWKILYERALGLALEVDYPAVKDDLGHIWHYWYDDKRDLLVTIGSITVKKDEIKLTIPNVFDVFNSEIKRAERLEELNLSNVQYCGINTNIFKCFNLKRFIAKHLVSTKAVFTDLSDVELLDNYDGCFFVIHKRRMSNIVAINYMTDVMTQLAFKKCYYSSSPDCYITLSKNNLRYADNWLIDEIDLCAEMYQRKLSDKNRQWFKKKRFRMKKTDIGYSTLKIYRGELYCNYDGKHYKWVENFEKRRREALKKQKGE